MRVLVIGASGFVGRYLVARLRRDGMAVTAAGRHGPCRCDLATDSTADWLPRLAGIDAVVNCAGLIRDTGGSYDAVHDRGARALFDACHAAGVRVIQISALGADDQATTRYHLTKRAADHHLARTASDWAIVRPSLIVGRGGQSTAMFASLATAPLPLRLGPGTWQLQPIHVDDLVEGIARLLVAPDRLAVRLDAVGPAPMTTDAITRDLRAWLGLRPAPFVPVPRWVIAATAWIGQRIGLGPATPESLAMLEAGNVGDVTGFVEACGFRPAPLAEALARTPASGADLRDACIAPLVPLLRVLLAVVWLAGGLIPLLLTPRADSIALLAAVGITGAAGLPVLAGAALIDLAIGLGVLLRVRSAALAGIVVMAGYSTVLAIAVPALWADPFGALVKNLAVLGLSLAVHALETRRG
jgi:uncharacterized protein YbjT (DUF2867 family)